MVKNLMGPILLVTIMLGCSDTQKTLNSETAREILEDKRLDTVYEMAREILKPEDGKFKGSNQRKTLVVF